MSSATSDDASNFLNGREGTDVVLEATEQIKFRSVLPHEPLPVESCGYLHLQGAFEPRKNVKSGDANQGHDNSEDSKEDVPFWTRSTLEQALLRACGDYASSRSPPTPHAAQSVQLLDHAPPYTKVRLFYGSPQAAREALSVWKRSKITPADLLHGSVSEDDHHIFSTRPVQITQVTTRPMISTQVSWGRSNPPKFRRLLARPGEDLASLEEERSKTRFVFITGVVGDEVPSCWAEPYVALDAIRQVMNNYDTSGLGVEVFVSHKKAIRYCHIGMRSSADARALITNLQGQQVEWSCRGWGSLENVTRVRSGKLFLDYADITQRSYAQGKHPDSLFKGEPSRSECTSLTASVVVPGLMIIPDFVSEEQEEVLMAVLTGPQAPWAPPQTTPSESGIVKRRVQHYGYVFDYKTADVLRDRTQGGRRLSTHARDPGRYR